MQDHLLGFFWESPGGCSSPVGFQFELRMGTRDIDNYSVHNASRDQEWARLELKLPGVVVIRQLQIMKRKRRAVRRKLQVPGCIARRR